MHAESFAAKSHPISQDRGVTFWAGDIHGDLGLNCELLIENIIIIKGPVGSGIGL